jgi:hypothetical protein
MTKWKMAESLPVLGLAILNSHADALATELRASVIACRRHPIPAGIGRRCYFSIGCASGLEKPNSQSFWPAGSVNGRLF